MQCRHALVLASASPRRQLFLQELGLTHTVVRPQGVEPQPMAGEAPDDYACRAAGAKARAVARACPQAVVLAADTVVALDSIILGKPVDAEDALRMLRLLAGRIHRVISAVSLALPGGGMVEFHDIAQVRFHPWPEKVLVAYAHTGEPFNKAGAYAIQGQGAFLVAELTGSWSTVVGLPVTQLVEVLLVHGLVEPVPYAPIDNRSASDGEVAPVS